MASPLSNRTYRRLLTAQIVALAGTGLTTIALALLAYDLAAGNAGVVLGLALTLKMMTYVTVAPAVGGFAHGLDRRRFLIALDIGRAATVLCLPLVTEVWQIYLLIVVLNACSAGFTPTFQSTIPDILSGEAQYTRALSLSRLAYDIENLLSPLAAALALAIFSYDALFGLNALAFLVSAMLVFSVRIPAPGPGERERGAWNAMSYGIRAYLVTPRLRGALALSLAVAGAGAMVIVNTVVYVRDRLGGSESDTALALAASGAGSMVLALALPRLLDKYPVRPFMLSGGILLGVGLLLGLTGPGPRTLIPVWFVLGAGSSLIQTPLGLLLTRSAHKADRPAIFAAHFALSHACWLLAYPAAGFIGSLYGMTATFSALAAVVVASTAAAAFLWPADDPDEIEHLHADFEHEHMHVHDEHHQHDHAKRDEREPHRHAHKHASVKHKHRFIIDLHHPFWPGR